MQNVLEQRPESLTFGVGSIKVSFHTIVFMHAIQMLLYTFQSNCAEGFHFSAFSFKMFFVLVYVSFVQFSNIII